MKGKKWFIPFVAFVFLAIGVLFISPSSFVSANDDLNKEVVEKTETNHRFGKGIGKRWKALDGSLRKTVEEVLQMTPEELLKERKEGKTLAEIAKEKGVSEEELLSAMMDVREKQLEQLVENGKITEEQKESRMERIEKRLTYFIENGKFMKKESENSEDM